MTAPPESEAPWFRTVVFHSVLAGLCPLVPVPFLDSALLELVNKRLVREIAELAGAPVTEPQVAVLSGAARLEPRGGCLWGCLRLAAKVSISLVLRIFKKILLFLTLTEAVHAASVTFHEGLFLHHVWTNHKGAFPEGEDVRQEAARRVRMAMVDAGIQVETRPIHQILGRVFRGSKRALADGVGVLVDGSKDGEATVPIDRVREATSKITDALTEELWEQQGYFAAACEAFDQSLVGSEE